MAPPPTASSLSPPSPLQLARTGDRLTDVSNVKIPEELIQIRAFVRWEEAGKPEDMTPEWQQVSVCSLKGTLSALVTSVI